MGMGTIIWEVNSNLGKTHFWGKSILTFEASKHPKMHDIGTYFHILHFFAYAGKLGSCFHLHDFAYGMFLLHDLGSWEFPHHHSPTLGLPQAVGNLLSVKSMIFRFVVYFFLTWAVVLHFS